MPNPPSATPPTAGPDAAPIVLAGRGLVLTDRLLAASPACRTGHEPDAGAAAIVIVGEPAGPDDPGADGLGRTVDPAAVRAALRSATAAGIGHVVLVSSAWVYGAWQNNPVPITEEAGLRPVPENRLAVACAEAERLVSDWCEAVAGRTAAILRPTLVVHEAQGSWLARSPFGGRGPALADIEPSRQFLDIGDLVDAVLVAADPTVDGVVNIAPDGWLAADQVRALAGPAPWVRAPLPIARWAQRRRWRGGPSVPFDGVFPYLVHPWVVANDAAREWGWAPRTTNEEAFVAATPSSLLGGMSPKRRQLLSLGGAAGAIVGALATVVILLRRRPR